MRSPRADAGSLRNTAATIDADGPDCSFEADVADRPHGDGYGHGTHLGGMGAGRDGDVTGMVPGARIVSIKVGDADSNGTTGISDPAQLRSSTVARLALSHPAQAVAVGGP